MGRSHIRRAVLQRRASKTQEAFLPAQRTNAQRMCEQSIAVTHTHTRLTALFRDYPSEPVPEW